MRGDMHLKRKVKYVGIIVLIAIMGVLIKDRIESKVSGQIGFLVLDEDGQVSRCVSLPKGVKGRIDYDAEQGNYLYLDKEEGIIVEKNLQQDKVVNEIKVEELLAMIPEKEKAESDEFEEDYTQTELCFSNVQYGYSEGTYSFIYNRMLYLYEREENKVTEIVTCQQDEDLQTYEWLDEENVYILQEDTNMSTIKNMVLWNCNSKSEKNVVAGPWNFMVDRENRKIFYSTAWWKDTDWLGFSLVELSEEVGKKESRTLVEDCEWALILYAKEERLFYCSQNYKGTKCKLYVIDLETGKRKKIYSTYMQIKGIVEGV